MRQRCRWHRRRSTEQGRKPHFDVNAHIVTQASIEQVQTCAGLRCVVFETPFFFYTRAVQQVTVSLLHTMSPTEELIEAVRQHKVRYNTTHPEYMKESFKGEIWTDIVSIL